MMYKYAMNVVKKSHESAGRPLTIPPESVIAVPFWFTDGQRRAIGHACEVAGVNCLRIINEPTAVALGYGYHKAMKGHYSSASKPVMFIDMGHTAFTVSIAAYYDDGLRVLAAQCDKHLGGRDIDDIVVEFCISQFHAKTGIDVRGNPKALRKLAVAAEKAKKTLSPQGVTEVAIYVECLAEERDLSLKLTRDEFEARLEILLGRLQEPIERALAEAQIDALKHLGDVEIVGGSTRVSAVKRRLGQLLRLDPNVVNNGLKTTMNADEAVVRGCALQCAIVSAHAQIKPYTLVDRLNSDIELQVLDSNSSRNGGNGANGDRRTKAKLSQTLAENQQPELITLFRRGDSFPNNKPKSVTIRRDNLNDFTVQCSYPSPRQSRGNGNGGSSPYNLIASFMVQMPTSLPKGAGRDTPLDVKIKFLVDECSGCLFVTKAELAYEPQSSGFGLSSLGMGSKKDTGKRVALKVDTYIPGDMSQQQINDAVGLEAAMERADAQLLAIADKRNELESYLYSTKGKIDQWAKLGLSAQEVAGLTVLLNQTEEWLYACENMTVADCEAKLKAIRRFEPGTGRR